MLLPLSHHSYLLGLKKSLFSRSRTCYNLAAMVRVRHKAATDHCCGTTAGNGAKHICVGILRDHFMRFILMKLHRKPQIPSNRGSRNSSRVNPTPVTELPKCWSTVSSTCAYCKKAGHWETLVPKGVSKVCKSLQPLQYASYWLTSLTPTAIGADLQGLPLRGEADIV